MSDTYDLADKAFLQQQLRQFGITPTPALSQNFLVDREVLDVILEAASLEKTDSILEVGAGTGVLTRELGTRVKHVVAVELDRQMLTMLRRTTRSFDAVTVIRADAAHEPIRSMLDAFPEKVFTYKVVANLPYHITSLFLHRFLEAEQPPTSMTLLVQQEVAERIVAEPGAMSMLALSVQVYAEPSLVATIPPTAFWPKPKVNSAVLHIERRRTALWPDAIRQRVFALAKAGFSAKRKTLANALAGSLRIPRPELLNWLTKHGITETARAQELAMKDWSTLADHLGELQIS